MYNMKERFLNFFSIVTWMADKKYFTYMITTIMFPVENCVTQIFTKKKKKNVKRTLCMYDIQLICIACIVCVEQTLYE